VTAKATRMAGLSDFAAVRAATWRHSRKTHKCQSAQQQQVRPKTSASCISRPAASPISSRIKARERWRRIMLLPPPPHPQRSSAVFKAAQYSCLRSMPDAVFRGRQLVSLTAYGLCCRMHHCFCALCTNNLPEPLQDDCAQRSTKQVLFGLDLFIFPPNLWHGENAQRSFAGH